ncbi:hypothetical protein BV898_06663 [Hypsibius exemplaris]|uniref:Uncharacterized protein n=1 Tax=Hypsibius exemplaris TaxID=2072580 RepID=A0A1W0WVN1_HYPEX|nr:hypothetical protein BV898_06663 [Hypsibius exemplaris]
MASDLLENEVYVQLMTVLRPCAAYPTGRILLSRWLTGDFANRYTGLWGKVEPSDLTQPDGLLRIAKSHGETCRHPLLDAPLESLKLVAVFQFDVPVEDNTECIYLLEVGNSDIVEEWKDCGRVNRPDGAVGDEWCCEWFDLDKIPYSRMPADDVLWYPLVLAGKLLRGTFKFKGEPKYTVKQYEITEVEGHL